VTPEQRLEAFRRFVERSPDDPFARYSLAMGQRGAGHAEAAVREFEELARRAPDYVPTYLMWGQVLETLGRAGEAAAIYEKGAEVALRARNDHARSELLQARDALRGQGT
jgi:tetratricopeptide (TPR) repeat protein